MNKVAFWNSPYPFRDLLLFSVKDKALNNSQIENIRKEALKINLTFLPQRTYGQISNFVITKDLEGFTQKNEVTFFSGIAQLNNKFYFGQKSLPLNESIQKELYDSVGLFTLIDINDENIKITQDFFGCGTLFYFDEKNLFIISNRYHLILLFLSWIGHKGRLDSDKVIATLYSDTTFLSQNISSKMDIIGVKQLAFDHEAKVDKDGWKIAPKESVIDALTGCSNKEYDELLEKGKKEVIDNIRAVIESNLFEKLITDLSGGMDSRSVFGAILNIEDVIKKIEIYTKDIPGSSDLQIAAGLKNLFGGSFYSEIGRPQFPMTVSESFDIWRSYFMGTYYRLAIGAWSPKGENNSQIRFSGGCGEIYRTFWSKIYRNKVDGANSIEELVIRLTNSFSRSAVAAYPNAQNRLNELLVNEISELPGTTPMDKFESHYVYFRNRYHFGMRAYECFHDCLMWFPLMSKSLFKASRSLTFEEKYNSKLMLELTERMQPILIWIDYASKPASNNKTLYNISISDIRFKGCKVLLDSNIDDWNAINLRNKEILQNLREKMNSKFYSDWKNVHQHLQRETINAFYELSSYSSDLDMILGKDFVNYIEKSSSNPRGIYQICSKLSSLRDQIAIFS
ncbi:hypothetical protein [Clostridium magnum]|uniref:Asparagine synthetase domain-containing protein n=1 Tax=Clostridium magnum DSM 2767 TaxID=1121326 RepID=A0A161X2G3_9CLOT|nr:hypothetical protein [Clostridium magnum]KZL93678.1 hypothetical protein CLMAG_07290 [Clostridium magnum DSM 2767]SHI92526.1 hypothetical protein SAMN02745944_05066 [Clostridium magnum DSM 2767]